MVGVGLAVLQQVTGINTVIYYAPTIVEFTGVNSSAGAILAAVGAGIVNVGMTLLALRLLDRAGRRTLLMIGVSGMSLSLFALGGAFVGGGQSTLAAAVAIGSLMVYVASFAVSLGPIFWLINAEIYPLGVRSKAAGRRHDGQLDGQLHRLADLPAADRRGWGAAAPSGSTAAIGVLTRWSSAGRWCRRRRASGSRRSRPSSRNGSSGAPPDRPRSTWRG